MMKWRVQGKPGGCSTRKSIGIRSAKRANAEDSDDVRASLDFLDQVIAEYNGNAAENAAVMPAPAEEDATVAKGGPDDRPAPAASDERPDVPPPPPHERFSVNLVIVNDVVKEEPGVPAADDTTPPPVPKRPPPSLPRSSSTGSVTSSREYPVSPPPRRRYLSPERRRRALMMNGNAANNGTTSASIPDSPDNHLDRRPIRRPIIVPLDPILQSTTPRPPAEQPRVTAVTCQSDTISSRTLLRTGSQPAYVDCDGDSPGHLDRVDCFGRDDGLRKHTTSAGDFRSPPVQTRLPKEFADLSSPMEVSRALVRTGSHASDNYVSSSADGRPQDGIVTNDGSLRRQLSSPICSRAFFYSSSKPCVLQWQDASVQDVGDEANKPPGTALRAASPSQHKNHSNDIAQRQLSSQNKSGSFKPAARAQNGRLESEDSKVARVVNGRDSPNGTFHDRDNTKLTVTFRTLPETGSFRRKSESRNSIHVDFNVRDGLPWNGRTQSAASPSNGDPIIENGHTAAVSSSAGLCRSRSLRSHRKPELSDGVAASRTMEDFSPPPLPPRKAKEEARRQAEENASPTLKRVTFHILPTTPENPEHKDRPSSAEKAPSAEDCPEDGFFTRPPPKTPSPVAGKGRAASPVCHRATNGTRSPVAGKIGEPSPQCQRRMNGCTKATPAVAKVNGVHGSKAGSRDTARTPQGHTTKDPKANPMVKKTFEPPPAASDVSTDCYNVYNVRTGKISSTVTKPNALGRSPARVPLESVQCANGTAATRSQLTKLRNMSPTREAEKLIGKIISRCKSSAVLSGKDKKPASSPPPPPSADGANAQPQLLKLTARQQQRHSRCTKCAHAQAAK
ncbi:uncharacterized protein [Dermacentor andersoni]|uniref:uncharacterized protein n=1 Tax=Dermacentor andersoni TaxID=34620 RepID=UPI00215500B8|nr:serine/arginine repetitive matrix protein 1-like [Dermacentor andersoni]